MGVLFAIGINHKAAPVELRERLAFSPEKAAAVLKALAGLESLPGVQACLAQGDEAALLSTCNRTELYLLAEEPESVEAGLMRFLASWAGLPPEALDPLLFSNRGEEVARRLLRVAAGLDSMFLGENEILGQVKAAGELAQAAGTCGPVLSALFRAAARAGKRARSETEIGRAGLSTAAVVVELACQHLGDLRAHKALLIGAGKISSAAAHALVRAGLRCILVANRTYERARKLAANLGEECASAVHFDALETCLSEADIVICSTGAPHFILHPDQVRAACASRPQQPLLVVDLAVPRDVDPQVANLPGVELVTLDDLEKLAKERFPLSAAARCQAEGIVEQELSDFQAWWEGRAVAPLIRLLQEKAQAVCCEQVARTSRRLGELTPEQQEALEVMGRAIANQLLHKPIQFLRENGSELPPEERERLFREVFGLEESTEKVL